MDVRVKEWIRSWMMGTATAGLLGPGLLAAQTTPPAAKPAQRPATVPQPGLLQPAPEAINLAAYESDAAGPQLAESEVEARLRELYERDGREMPNMTITPPAAAGQAPAAPQAVPASQPRYSSAPPTAPAPAPKAQNRVTGFFKKLVPGGNRKPPAQPASQPPRQQHAAGQAPRNVPPRALAQPQTVAQPQSTMPPAAPQYQPAPQAPAAYGQAGPEMTIQPQPNSQPPRVSAPVMQAARPVPAARPIAPTPAPASQVAPRVNEPALPAASPTQVAAPQFGEPEISFESEDTDLEEMELDDLDIDSAEPPVAAPAASPTAGFDEEFPDPFAGTTEGESSSEPIENPYTGQTLEPLDVPSAQPATQLTPSIMPHGRIDRTSLDETTATKMRRIIQRTDMKGLKGFCPVTLRDQRELADSRPEHVATYRGQKFYCASKVAQAKFEAEPARYAPAAYGADVVVLTDDQDVAEGSLDYAAWYKGRLYLFGSQDTHDTFVTNPERYASPPGIE